MRRAARPSPSPDRCPVCGARAVRPEGEVVVRCTGGLVCPAQTVERLIHLASRTAFDIEGLGEKSIREFHEAGLIAAPADIFRLSPERIAGREGWKDVSITKLMRAIDERRTIPLARFIFGLGIRRIGETNARLLARHYGSYAHWRAQMEAATVVGSDERLALGSITGVGETIAGELATFFAEAHNRQAVDALAAELREIQDEAATRGGTLAGKAIVFTGSLASLTRPEARGDGAAAGGQGHRQRVEEDGPRGAGQRRRLEGEEGGRARHRHRGRGRMAGAGGVANHRDVRKARAPPWTRQGRHARRADARRPLEPN